MALLLPKPPTKKDPATRGGADKDDKQKEAIIDTAATVESIDKTLFGFTGFLNKKQNKKFQQKQEMYQRKALKIQEQQNDGGKDKKTTKKWRKVVDFLYGGVKGLFKAVGAIVKSLSLSKVTGLLGLLLGIFLMLKLGLLDIVLPAALDLFLTLIKGIIKFLPKILKFLWTVVSEYIPKIISAIADAISDALGIKSKTGRKMVKIFTAIGVGLLALNKLMGLFGKNVFSLLKYLPGLISKIFPMLGRLIGFLNPVGLVAAIVTAVWIFAEKIVKVYDWIIEKVFDLVFSFFPSLKPFKDVIVTMAKTFLMLTPNIYSLARLFANIKKLGFLEGIKKTIKEFLGSLADIGAGIAGFFLGWSPKRIKKEAEATKKILFGMFDKFISFLKENIFPVWTELKNTFSTAFDMVADTFTEVWKEVKVIGKELYNEFSTIFSEISPIFSEIFGGLFSKDNEKSVGGFKTFFVFFQKFLKTSLTFLKPFLKFFSKIFIEGLKILAVIIKALIRRLPGFIKGVKTFFVFFQKFLKTGLSFLKPFLKFFSKIFIISFKTLAVIITKALKGIKTFVTILKKIKNIKFGAVLQSIWTGISSFFKKMMGGIIEKFKPIKEFFTSIGEKIGDFFEPAIRKIKLLVSTIGDVFGSIIDWILYTVAPLIPGLDRGAAKSAEEYRLISYASKQASDTDSRGRIEQYAKAVMRKDKDRMKELAEQMTSSQQALATSMAGSGMANLESYSNRLKQGGDFLTSRTKIFGTPVNNSASL